MHAQCKEQHSKVKDGKNTDKQDRECEKTTMAVGNEQFWLTREERWPITGPESPRAARSYKKTTVMGTDAFQRRILLDFGDETWQKVAVFLHVVDVMGK